MQRKQLKIIFLKKIENLNKEDKNNPINRNHRTSKVSNLRITSRLVKITKTRIRKEMKR